MKPKLKIVAWGAAHFLRWELPLFSRDFQLVQEPGPDVVVLAFGPDALDLAALLPARRRVAMLFPGFALNPYHNLEYREYALSIIDSCYDLVFVNPGGLAEAYKSSPKICVCPFSIDTHLVPCQRYRTSIRSLLHVSADYPQKDWRRSERIMRMTGLPHEVFPPREPRPALLPELMKRQLNRYAQLLGMPRLLREMPEGYVEHRVVIRKYQEYDGFVHVAAECTDGYNLDGKYTASLLEAGLTGAILFWHDTLGLGNDFETIFDLPLEPLAAARAILEIRDSLDVAKHSRLTREEILDKCNAEGAVSFRCAQIKALL